MPKRKILRHATRHGDHRAEAYPAIGDQLDAVMKGFRSLAEAGHVFPPETMAVIERCEAVKARFPKSQNPPASGEA